jgi:DNA-binding beta-propeller fold protein YncE
MTTTPNALLLLAAAISAIFPLALAGRAPKGNSMPPVLLVANQDDRNLSFIDPASAKQVATVDETGITGHEVAASPDGRTAYVPIYGDSVVGKQGLDGHTVDVIDIASRRIISTVDFGHGVRPHCVIFEPVSGMLYVTTEVDRSVTIIDPKTLKIAGSIPTGQAESHMLAISHDGRRGYTANVGPGTVSVLDMNARKTIAIIPIATKTQRISISNDDTMVFTADQTKPQLAVIDTSTNQIRNWIALPAIGYGTALTKDGRWLLVAVPSLNKVAVVDMSSLEVVRTTDVGRRPSEILVRPDGLIAYVSCVGSHEVDAIDLTQWKVQAAIQAGEGSDGLAWAQ